MIGKHGSKTSFDPEHTFDVDSGLASIEYGVTIAESQEETGHWSDLVPHMNIPGF